MLPQPEGGDEKLPVAGGRSIWVTPKGAQQSVRPGLLACKVQAGPGPGARRKKKIETYLAGCASQAIKALIRCEDWPPRVRGQADFVRR